MDGVVHGRGHVLGPVAAAFRAELGELAEHLVHVAGEVVGARHVGVADVAIGHERDAQVGTRPAFADAPRDRPDAPLGAVDEAAHAPGGVEHEGHLHPRPGRDLLLRRDLRRWWTRGDGGRGSGKGKTHKDNAHDGTSADDTGGAAPIFPRTAAPLTPRARDRVRAKHTTSRPSTGTRLLTRDGG